MEDKSFEFLTKIYNELTEFRNESNTRFDKIDARLDKLEGRQNKFEVIVEHDIKTNLQALHEKAEDNTIKLNGLANQVANANEKLDYLSLSVNSQDKRLQLIESSKRKNVK